MFIFHTKDNIIWDIERDGSWKLCLDKERQPFHSYIRTNTHTKHTHTHSHSHKHTSVHTHTHTHTHSTNTNAHAHKHTHAHIQQTQIHTFSLLHIRKRKYTHYLSLLRKERERRERIDSNMVWLHYLDENTSPSYFVKSCFLYRKERKTTTHTPKQKKL